MVIIELCNKDTQPSQTCSEGYTFLLLHCTGVFLCFRGVLTRLRRLVRSRFCITNDTNSEQGTPYSKAKELQKRNKLRAVRFSPSHFPRIEPPWAYLFQFQRPRSRGCASGTGGNMPPPLWLDTGLVADPPPFGLILPPSLGENPPPPPPPPW